MARFATLAYGGICYAIFFATFLYLVGFVGNAFVPVTVDSGVPGDSLWVSLGIDVVLIGLFGLQHSVMARPAFKRRWTRIVPAEAERSTYVLFSSLILILQFWAWQPIPNAVWDADGSAARGALTALFFLGVALVLYSTFLIDHFDLFGLRQVFLHFRGRAYSEKRFATPSLYRFIRHPLYVGWFITFWATPTMSVGHLVLAAGMTLYMLIAIPYEERDLVRALGASYERYRARTPMFVPRIPRRAAGASAGATPTS
jgi:protein-S-isoprenylcysteine O-methyltransferase Ste14